MVIRGWGRAEKQAKEENSVQHEDLKNAGKRGNRLNLPSVIENGESKERLLGEKKKKNKERGIKIQHGMLGQDTARDQRKRGKSNSAEHGRGTEEDRFILIGRT